MSVQTFLQQALNNGRMFCQAISFDPDATKGKCLAVIALSIDGQPGMARVHRITATSDYGSEDVPVENVGSTECWAWFRLGADDLAIPLGSNLGRMIGAQLVDDEEGETAQ